MRLRSLVNLFVFYFSAKKGVVYSFKTAVGDRKFQK